MKTDNVMVPRELLADLADLASDAAEQHRQAMGIYRPNRQAVIDRAVVDARTLLAQRCERCERCDGTGDVHGLDGEWRGECDCAQPASEAVYAWASPDNRQPVLADVVERLRLRGGYTIPLYTHPPAPAVPDGWQLVPVEPTPEMQLAGAQAIRFETTQINKLWTGNAVFRAMAAAAQAAPGVE